MTPVIGSQTANQPVVLVADDEVLLHRALQRALSNAGCDYVGALDGSEVMELARAKKPDAILLDVSMPAMDGRDVLALLKQDAELAKVPVVVITGNMDSHLRLSALADGAYDVVEKPFDPVMLGRRISWMIEKKRSGDI